jgi:soluble lytic murein transglycosylase-like protein
MLAFSTALITALGIKAQIVQETYTESLKYGIDPILVLAIIKTESNFKITAIGASHKERGLMQLHPRYFPTAKLDIKTNIATGIKHLAKMKKACENRYKDAWFVCYNTGASIKLKYPKLHTYYRKVYENYNYKARNNTHRVCLTPSIR